MNLDRAMARAWAEVDEDAFLDNYRLARSLCDEKTKFICVVKANAYGLGLFRAVKTLAEAGADWFAVAAPEEALTVRRAAPSAHILLLSPGEESYLPDLIRQGISLTVGSVMDARKASEAAVALGMEAIIQIKLDTGLHRLGFEDAKSPLPILSMPALRIEGVYSHLALRSREQSMAQEKLFTGLVNKMESLGFPVPMRHLVDSIGLTRYPQWQMDAVRVGAFLYGNVPPAWERFHEGKQVMALKARITRVAWVKKGEGVGYDDTPLEKDTLVATISAGYIDGYPRVLSQKGFVSIHGKRAPVLGLVCMDQMMVDVTDVPQTQAGDVATLMGNEITLQEYAAWGHLNRNECLGIIGRRVPRVYFRNGNAVAVSAEMEENI